MSCTNNFMHNTTWYALMLEKGNYRAACVESIRALRRCRGRQDEVNIKIWEFRVRECFRRRHA